MAILHGNRPSSSSTWGRFWDYLLAGGPVERVRRAEAEVWQRLEAEGFRAHRAGNDVRYLITMYQILALGY